jgi:hypothetical protein
MPRLVFYLESGIFDAIYKLSIIAFKYLYGKILRDDETEVHLLRYHGQHR